MRTRKDYEVVGYTVYKHIHGDGTVDYTGTVSIRRRMFNLFWKEWWYITEYYVMNNYISEAGILAATFNTEAELTRAREAGVERWITDKLHSRTKTETTKIKL